jgi:hypothetical protein
MGANFKLREPPSPAKGPVPILAPDRKEMLDPFPPTSTEVANRSSPDGLRKGFTVLPSGRRAYKDEIPFPPASPPPGKPMKVK